MKSFKEFITELMTVSTSGGSQGSQGKGTGASFRPGWVPYQFPIGDPIGPIGPGPFGLPGSWPEQEGPRIPLGDPNYEQPWGPGPRPGGPFRPFWQPKPRKIPLPDPRLSPKDIDDLMREAPVGGHLGGGRFWGYPRQPR